MFLGYEVSEVWGFALHSHGSLTLILQILPVLANVDLARIPTSLSFHPQCVSNS